MSENINGTRSETEIASVVENHVKMHRAASNDTTLLAEIPNIINEENVIVASEQGTTPVQILSDEFYEEQAFLHFHKGKFGHNVA